MGRPGFEESRAIQSSTASLANAPSKSTGSGASKATIAHQQGVGPRAFAASSSSTGVVESIRLLGRHGDDEGVERAKRFAGIGLHSPAGSVAPQRGDGAAADTSTSRAKVLRHGVHAGHADITFDRRDGRDRPVRPHGHDAAIPGRHQAGLHPRLDVASEARVSRREVLRTVVEVVAVRSPVRGPPADAAPALEHSHREPLVAQGAGSGEPRDPGADHGDALHVLRAARVGARTVGREVEPLRVVLRRA